MQDEVRDKSVALVVNVGKKGGRITEEMLKWAIREYMKQAKAPHHGKQSVKSLVRQGDGVQNIEITDKNIKSFENAARKYGVDFALRKSPEEGKYFVFFKAKEADALNAAFAEYTQKVLKREKAGQEKPSLRKQLAKFRQLAAQMAQTQEKEKHLGRGGIEH